LRNKAAFELAASRRYGDFTRAFELAASRRYGDFHIHYFLGVNVATSTAAGVARVAALEAAAQ